MVPTIFPFRTWVLNCSKSQRRRTLLSYTALLLSIGFTTSVALGAPVESDSVVLDTQVEPNYYASLLAEVNATGVVAVMVGIANLSLEKIAKNPAAVRAEMEEKAKPLLAELGENVFDASYWNNGMGQIGFYVTAKGLQILVDSAYAKMLMPDSTAKTRSKAYNSDGSLDAVEAAINANGFADVEVFLNIDEGDYDIGKDGKITFRPSSGLSNQIMVHLNSINAQGFAKSFKNFDASPTLAAAPSPSFLVRIDRNAFYGLRVSKDVRAIRPIGFVDARPAQWPIDVLAEAAAGELLVGYGLRNNATATVKDSFQDMVSKQRYSVVWVIGAPQRSSASICLSATQMTLGGALDALPPQ